jgi:hypothetical protein
MIFRLGRNSTDSAGGFGFQGLPRETGCLIPDAGWLRSLPGVFFEMGDLLFGVRESKFLDERRFSSDIRNLASARGLN